MDIIAATKSRNLRNVELSIYANPNINKVDTTDDLSALMIAINNLDVEIIDLLLKHSSQREWAIHNSYINYIEQWESGDTALLLAIKLPPNTNENTIIQIVNLLLKYGANPGIKDELKTSIISIAIEYERSIDLIENLLNIPSVKQLINDTDDNMDAPLELAILKGDPNIVKLLIDNKVDLNRITMMDGSFNYKWTPILLVGLELSNHRLTQNNKIKLEKIAELLINANANILSLEEITGMSSMENLNEFQRSLYISLQNAYLKIKNIFDRTVLTRRIKMNIIYSGLSNESNIIKDIAESISNHISMLPETQRPRHLNALEDHLLYQFADTLFDYEAYDKET